jgi:predicted DNA-binding WGR domain protein
MKMFWLLHRRNEKANIHRYYLIQVGASLFHSWTVTRYWGRIGGKQQGMITPCESYGAAEKFARKLLRRKLRRGYYTVISAEMERGNG